MFDVDAKNYLFSPMSISRDVERIIERFNSVLRLAHIFRHDPVSDTK